LLEAIKAMPSEIKDIHKTLQQLGLKKSHLKLNLSPKRPNFAHYLIIS
jgi:hypothetical protein